MRDDSRGITIRTLSGVLFGLLAGCFLSVLVFVYEAAFLKRESSSAVEPMKSGGKGLVIVQSKDLF